MAMFNDNEMAEITRKVASGDWKSLNDDDKRNLLADFECVEFFAIGGDLRDYRAMLWDGFTSIRDMPIEDVNQRLQDFQDACTAPWEE